MSSAGGMTIFCRSVADSRFLAFSSAHCLRRVPTRAATDLGFLGRCLCHLTQVIHFPKTFFVLCCCCCCGAGRLTLSVLPHALYWPISETVGPFPNFENLRGRKLFTWFSSIFLVGQPSAPCGVVLGSPQYPISSS